MAGRFEKVKVVAYSHEKQPRTTLGVLRNMPKKKNKFCKKQRNNEEKRKCKQRSMGVNFKT